ncbi:hypothetical protein ABW20_dc0110142 [Dactylellina cionopaga]|nr:hypothetical protein ABW20_dc0110142 [Dactylellina cionopaga]
MQSTYQYRDLHTEIPNNCECKSVARAIEHIKITGPTTQTDAYFFPANLVDDIFLECDALGSPVRRDTLGAAPANITKVSIKKILRCQCTQCHGFTVNDPGSAARSTGDITARSTRSVLLVAILCWIGTPHLILPMYNSGISDNNLDLLPSKLENLIRTSSQKDYFPAAISYFDLPADPKSMEAKLRDFENFRKTFSYARLRFYLRPILTWNNQFIPSTEILPIIEMAKCGEGNFGQVEMIILHPYYSHFGPGHTTVRKIAA